MLDRMKTTLFGLTLLSLVSCGSADGLDPDDRALQGTWVAPLANGGAFEWTFAGHGYALRIISPLGDGTVGVELEKGTFDTAGARLTFAPEQWTCLGTYAPYAFDFTVSASTLTLTNEGRVSVAPRGAAMPVDNAALGCFEEAGFVVHPLGPTQ